MTDSVGVDSSTVTLQPFESSPLSPPEKIVRTHQRQMPCPHGRQRSRCKECIGTGPISAWKDCQQGQRPDASEQSAAAAVAVVVNAQPIAEAAEGIVALQGGIAVVKLPSNGASRTCQACADVKVTPIAKPYHAALFLTARYIDLLRWFRSNVTGNNLAVLAHSLLHPPAIHCAPSRVLPPP